MKILKRRRLVRARIFLSIFAASAPRRVPPYLNPPTFAPRFSSQALANGGPELKKSWISPSTSPCNLKLLRRSWPKPAQTLKRKTFLSKKSPIASFRSPPGGLKCGSSIANNMIFLDSQFFAWNIIFDHTWHTKSPPNQRKFEKIHRIYEPICAKADWARQL